MNIHQQYDVHPKNGQHRSFFIQIFSYAGALKNDYLARPVGQFGILYQGKVVAKEAIYLCIVMRLSHTEIKDKYNLFLCMTSHTS